MEEDNQLKRDRGFQRRSPRVRVGGFGTKGRRRRSLAAVYGDEHGGGSLLR